MREPGVSHRSRSAVLIAAGVVVLVVALVGLGRSGRGAGAVADTTVAKGGWWTGVGTVTSETAEHPYRKLTADEEAVIVKKGTDAPFGGEYDRTFADGVYACRQCGALLYRSDSKFDAGCGWPAFEAEIPGAVKRTVDPDGVRTEITCTHCGAHLGHVFTGEGLTKTDARHCVNSTSLQFIPRAQIKVGRAIFAGGCFWGVEYEFEQVPGVLQATSGYTGGTTEHPTYEDVHEHETGHAEAVEVLYDPVRVTYETLAKMFFEIHDATQKDGQGPDIGSAYRSEIFTTNEDQARIAKRLIAELKARGMDIATRVTPAGKFWKAEAYHQDWYAKKGEAPACHARRKLW